MLRLYHLLILDGAGQVSQVVSMRCVNDEDAIANSENYSSISPMELWHAGKRLKCYPPRPEGG